MGEPGFKVYVGNLPYSFVDRDLEDLFKNYQIVGDFSVFLSINEIAKNLDFLMTFVDRFKADLGLHIVKHMVALKRIELERRSDQVLENSMKSH
ncbi:hypothetical protein AC249_AIPGENE8081 [Exaiptasia diaphana]|nr:hypothetical protein AC249_AIPGENE8081 [Exaiptasia diaphana]